MSLRVLACGGRDYQNAETVWNTLDCLHAHHGVDNLIAGAARGADMLAAAWARERGIPVLEFPAQWDLHGKGAGPIRNRQMLDEGRPNYVVAFPGGAGTADMVRRARAAGLTVWEVA